MSLNNKKLVFIMHDRPSYPGGPIINYRRLLPALANIGHEIHLICFYKDDYPNAREISKSNIRIYPHPLADTKTSLNRIFYVLKATQPDAFIPDVSTPGCFAGKWALKCGIPVITTLRSDDKNNWGRAVYFSHPLHNHLVTGTVCVSEYLEKELFKKTSPHKINTAVIPSGVSIPEISANQISNPLRLVYAGRLVKKQKNIFQVIDTFITICSTFSHIECQIIGDGPELDTCRALVNTAKMDERITFTHFLTDPEYSRHLSQNHIIVLFSDYEGTPGALLDGMACGLIPVVLRYPGVENLIKHKENGWIIENTKEDFIDVIKMLSGSEEFRILLSDAAKKTIAASYSLDVSVMKWEKFIESCIQQTNPKKSLAFPKWILLPKYNRMLVEDLRPKRKGRLSFFFKFIDRILIT